METIIAHLREDVEFGTVASSSAEDLALSGTGNLLTHFAQDLTGRKSVCFLTETRTLIPGYTRVEGMGTRDGRAKV